MSMMDELMDDLVVKNKYLADFSRRSFEEKLESVAKTLHSRNPENVSLSVEDYKVFLLALQKYENVTINDLESSVEDQSERSYQL